MSPRSTPGRNKCCITYVYAVTPHPTHSYNRTAGPLLFPLVQEAFSLSFFLFLSTYLPAVAYHTMSLARESIDARRKERSKALHHHYCIATERSPGGEMRTSGERTKEKDGECRGEWQQRQRRAPVPPPPPPPARTNVACKYKTALGQGSVIYRLPRVIGCRPIDTYPPGLPAGT